MNHWMLAVCLLGVLSMCVLPGLGGSMKVIPSPTPAVATATVVLIKTKAVLQGTQEPLFRLPELPLPELPRIRWCVVGTDGQVLNLRKGPSMDSEILNGLLPGKWVQILDVSGDGRWWHVRAWDEETGWIRTEFCKEVQ